MFDVDEATFESRVLERSHELPVVVDFWAEWCAPCRALGPLLERAAAARAGKVELAKLDTDANTGLAARFRIQGIPAVKAFRDGKVVAEFTGALPAPEVERFFDALVPSEADELARAGESEGDPAALRRALELDPGNLRARRALGRLLLADGEHEAAIEVLKPAGPDFEAEGLTARARLRLAGHERAGTGLDAWDRGERSEALEQLQGALAEEEDPDLRDLVRRVLVGIFTELGAEDPLVPQHRRRLAAALN